MKINLALIVLILISLCSHGQKRFLNPDYVIETRSEYRLLVAPSPGVNAEYVDSVMAICFDREWQQLIIIPSAEVASVVSKNSSVKVILEKIRNTSYSNDEMRKFPGLNSAISEYEANYLSQVMYDAHLLVIPTSLNMYSPSDTSGQKMTAGTLDVRVYDLTTGQLALVYREASNVMQNGKEGKQKVAELMVNGFCRYFHKSFIEEQQLD